MEQHDGLRSIEIQELRNRMDRALDESAGGEGASGEEFIQRMLDDLDMVNGAKLDEPAMTGQEGESYLAS